MKNYIIAAILICYSLGLWHVSAGYTSNKWQKENVELTQKALETTQQRAELANLIGTQLETKLQNIQITKTTINQKVIHEVTKEPVYTECRTTPDGVRLIEDTIHNQGQSPSQ